MKTLVCCIGLPALLLLGIGLCAQEVKTFVSAGTQSAPDLGIKVRRLSPRAAVFNVGPWDNAYLALSTQKGIVVIDSGFSKTIAQEVRKAIETEFKRSDFVYLINSHEHSDHAFGNSAYSDIPIVGSDLLRAAILGMKSDPAIIADRLAIPEQSLARIQQDLLKNPKLLEDPEISQSERFWKTVQADYAAGVDYLPPTITFDRRMTLYLGDVSVQLFSYGHWHSKADTIISVPEEGLVRLGAIFSNGHLSAGYLPVVNSPYGPKEPLTASIVNNWIAVLNEVLGLSNEKTRFVSCHGWTVMNKAEISPQVAYLEKLWNEVRRAKAAGKTLEQTKAALPRAERFSETADLVGTADGVPNIHEHNIEAFWNAVDPALLPDGHPLVLY
jgi:glyoxylase-like metal-dependent hydrolase (beta-lactamase superfamily II)